MQAPLHLGCLSWGFYCLMSDFFWTVNLLAKSSPSFSLSILPSGLFCLRTLQKCVLAPYFSFSCHFSCYYPLNLTLSYAKSFGWTQEFNSVFEGLCCCFVSYPLSFGLILLNWVTFAYLAEILDQFSFGLLETYISILLNLLVVLRVFKWGSIVGLFCSYLLVCLFFIFCRCRIQHVFLFELDLWHLFSCDDCRLAIAIFDVDLNIHQIICKNCLDDNILNYNILTFLILKYVNC